MLVGRYLLGFVYFGAMILYCLYRFKSYFLSFKSNIKRILINYNIINNDIHIVVWFCAMCIICNIDIVYKIYFILKDILGSKLSVFKNVNAFYKILKEMKAVENNFLDI